jgi:hypothetical protein
MTLLFVVIPCGASPHETPQSPLMTYGFTLPIEGELATLSQDDQYRIHHEDVRRRPDSSADGGRSEGKGNRHGSPPMALQRDRTPQLLREYADQLPAERFGGMDV